MADYKKLIQKLIEAGGENSSKALTALKTGEDRLPAFLRESAEATVEDPRLVKQAAKRVLPDIETSAVQLADDLALPQGSQLALPPSAGTIADDVVSSMAPKASMSNLKKGLAIGAGGAALTGMMMNGEGEEEKLNTSIPTEILNKANRQLPSGTKPDIKESIVKKQTNLVQDAFKDSLAPQEPSMGMPQEDDFEARLKEARNQDNERELLFGLLRAAQQGGSAIAGSKADTSFADAELANKNKFAGILSADEKLKKENKEKLDEDVLRDPNSDISKQARDIAKKVGLKIGPNVTAQQLKTAGLPIGNLLTQQMAIDSRKEQSALQREMIAATRSEKKERDAEKQDIKQRDSVDKLVKNVMTSDDYKGYQGAKAAGISLANAIASGDKTAIGSSFMLYGKIAQGDNSVLRESDMKNLAGSMNYSSPSEMLAKLSAKAKGADFTPKELENMMQVTKMIENIKARQLKQQLVPIQTRFEKYGLDPAESMDPSLIRELSEQRPESPSDLTTISKQPAKSVGMPVKVQDTQTGKVKVLSADRAATFLADPRFQRVE